MSLATLHIRMIYHHVTLLYVWLIDTVIEEVFYDNFPSRDAGGKQKLL